MGVFFHAEQNGAPVGVGERGVRLPKAAWQTLLGSLHLEFIALLQGGERIAPPHANVPSVANGRFGHYTIQRPIIVR